MAEPTPNPTPQGGEKPPAPEPTKTDPPALSVEEQIEAAVAVEKAKWDKELDSKIKAAQDEAARLAKLSAEERRKEEDKAAKEKFEREKAEFEQEKLVMYAEMELAKVNLSTDIAKYIAKTDKETTKTIIDAIKASYDKDVQNGVAERLKGKTPPLGGGQPTETGGFMDIIRENQR